MFWIYVRAVGAMMIWMAATISVAMPAAMVNWNLSLMSADFLGKFHYVALLFLVWADLLISIGLLKDQELRERMSSPLGWVSIGAATAMTLLLPFLQYNVHNLFTGWEQIVFWILLSLYGLVRIIMYAQPDRLPAPRHTATPIDKLLPENGGN